MKVVLFLCMLVAAASAGSPVVNKYMVPTGVNRFMNLLKLLEHGRIVGGSEVAKGSRPFQVGLFLTLPDGTAFCGGSLVSPKYVLTAAHCVYDGKNTVTDFEAVLGAHTIRDPDNLRIQSKTAIVHAGWNPSNLQNDLALIELPIEVELSDTIQTVHLPPYSAASLSFLNNAATASGWGLEHDGSTTIAANLNAVVMNVITNTVCNIRYLGNIKATHICTSGEDKKSTCNGDSGGPLTVVYNGKTIQVGVVSFGIAFGCEIGWPPVFTRVTSYLDWIAQHAGVEIEP